jgi:hypothetical protein
MAAHSTWKPPFPVTDPTQAKYWQSISQWLRVPWSHSYNLTYSGSSALDTVQDMPSASATLQFKKLRDDTTMLFQITGSAACSTAAAVGQWVIRVNGTNTNVARKVFNTANAHNSVCGATVVGTLNAGTYTFTLGWYHTSTANAVTVDGNDHWAIVVTEANPYPDR